jgi:DNA polymerase III epsilon subunit-like protein
MNYIVIDTETTNGFDDPLVYDCGWAVIDDNGTVLKARSYVVADVFCNEELMKNAYFADKIPQYVADVADGKRKMAWFENVKKVLRKDCKKFNVTAIMAHNMRFDYRSCTRSQRYITKSANRWFYPYGVQLWDTLRMARETFGHDEDYRNFCSENGYMMKNNSPRMTAEILYRYLSGDNDFEEQHTGLADVMIEKEIFKACMDRNPNCAKKVWSD